MTRRSLLAVVLVAVSCARGDAAPPVPKGMVPSYLALVAALADDRVEPVAGLATELRAGADAHAGKPGIAKVIAATAKLSATDIDATRRALEPLSEGMIEYMRAAPDTQGGNVIIHCTMAFENAGALWVQHDDKVANPYYGASMLRCGNKLAWDAELPKTAEL